MTGRAAEGVELQAEGWRAAEGAELRAELRVAAGRVHRRWGEQALG